MIIVNDGSTDNSLTLAKQFESEKIRVFSQDNKGLCFAKNLWVERNMENEVNYIKCEGACGMFEGLAK